MSDDDSILEAKLREKARLLEQAAAIDRELAEIEQARQIAARYGLTLTRGNERQAHVRPEAPPPPPPPEIAIPSPAATARPGKAPETIGGLVRDYETNPTSPFRGKRYAGRTHTMRLDRTIDTDAGDWRIDQIDEEKILRLYGQWSSGGGSIAHARINHLRSIVLYGARTYDDPAYIRLSYILRNLRFKPPKVRPPDGVTAVETEAFVARAKAIGIRSMALAQAFQFDAKLSQKDVIGEWVPASEAEHSDIYSPGGHQKWVRGIRWSEIENQILRHKCSRNGEIIEVDLSRCPNVMRALDGLSPLPKSGPIVVFEQYGLPYSGTNFRITWRRIARQVGIKDNVKNSATRFANDEKSAGTKHLNGSAGNPRGTLAP